MGAEETKEKLIMLRSITAEQQKRGAEALEYKGAAAGGTAVVLTAVPQTMAAAESVEV